MLQNKVGLNDIADKLRGKRVLMRVDFNVPIDGKSGTVSDRTRVVATIPSIRFLFEHGAKSVVLMSHLGRPDGRRQEKYSLAPVVPVLEELMQKPVTFLSDCVGHEVEEKCTGAAEGSLILLENLRFHVEEEGKGENAEGKKISATPEETKKFAESLSKLGEIFVNDAFGTAHRAHSSMVGVNLPIRAAGLLMKKELEFFGRALENPPTPFLLILGGAKVTDKIKLIKNMLDKVQTMIIGGGMAYTFKSLDKISIGSSLFDKDGAALVPEILEKAASQKVEIVLPVDYVCGDKFDKDAKIHTYDDSTGVPDGWMAMDCGPKSIAKAKEIIMQSKMILWNGPQGVFEFPNFAHGSNAFLDAVVEATKAGAVSIVGGGDTASLVMGQGKENGLSHVSTGGGATLELLEGRTLPGVKMISDLSSLA